MTASPLAPPAAPVRARRSILAALCACTVLVVGFVASINLAVPMLAASTLHPTSSQLLWIVDAYVVLFACLVIPGGAAGDRFGRKGVLLTGLVVFAVGATASAASTGVALMLVGRGVTGVGAALVLPNSLAVLIHATEPSRRRSAIAVWALMSGVGGMIGNVGGGALLAAGSWRLLFAAVVPLALGCAAWVAVSAPRSARRTGPLDPLGTLLLTTATVALVVGIVEGPEHGWGSATVLGAFGAAVCLYAAWAVAGLRARHPLLDPRLFRIPALSAACAGMLVMFFGCFGLFYLNASLLQYGHGYSVLKAGFGILPMTVPLLLLTRYVPGLVARFGIPATLAAAFLTTSAGLFGLSFAAGGGYLGYAAWLVLIGVGIALALPSLTAEITASLPHEQAGVGGGLQSATRELGSALGIAVVGTVITQAFTRESPIQPGPRTVAAALAAAPDRTAAITQAFVDAATTALRTTSAVVLVAGALITLLGVTTRPEVGRPRSTSA